MQGFFSAFLLFPCLPFSSPVFFSPLHTVPNMEMSGPSVDVSMLGSIDMGHGVCRRLVILSRNYRAVT